MAGNWLDIIKKMKMLKSILFPEEKTCEPFNGKD